MSTASSTAELLVTVGRQPLVAEVRRALFGPCGVVRGERIVVAVSGGADSSALLLSIAAIARRSRRSGGVDPVVVHVDHGLRSDSADDARFVRRLSGRLDLPCEIVRAEGLAAAIRRGGNAEDVARRMRYRILSDCALRVGAATIATAHHAEDQLETILMNLCRGCGAGAIGGMAWRRPADGVAIVRPLLESTRVACRQLCRVARVRWRHDATNDDLRRTRARLRTDVLPVLESIWPGSAVRAAIAARRLRELMLGERVACEMSPDSDGSDATPIPSSPVDEPAPQVEAAPRPQRRRSRT